MIFGYSRPTALVIATGTRMVTLVFVLMLGMPGSAQLSKNLSRQIL
jgi:hypothetical protein